MKRVLISFAIALVLSGCSAFSRNEPESKTPFVSAVSTNNHNETDWLFEKKLRCAGVKAAFAKEWEGWQIDEMFYSPKRNSCVATMQLVSAKGETKSVTYQVTDALTGESLYADFHAEKADPKELGKHVDEWK